MSSSTVVYMRGKAFYPKILGEPVPNYNKDGKEWTMDFQPSPEDLKKFKTLGISDRLKEKDEGVIKGKYITLKQRELRADGEKNKPIKVVDKNGKPWDIDTRIGNESVVDVKLNIRDFGAGRKKGIYLNAVRVLEHVPFEGGNDFPALTEEDEFFSSDVDVGEIETSDSSEEDLNDDVPF